MSSHAPQYQSSLYDKLPPGFWDEEATRLPLCSSFDRLPASTAAPKPRKLLESLTTVEDYLEFMKEDEDESLRNVMEVQELPKGASKFLTAATRPAPSWISSHPARISLPSLFHLKSDGKSFESAQSSGDQTALGKLAPKTGRIFSFRCPVTGCTRHYSCVTPPF